MHIVRPLSEHEMDDLVRAAYANNRELATKIDLQFARGVRTRDEHVLGMAEAAGWL